MATRTTHRSRTGTKLYAVRNKAGQFDDIQTYKRAHGQDLKRSSATELAAKKTKKVSKRKATKKTATTKTGTRAVGKRKTAARSKK